MNRNLIRAKELLGNGASLAIINGGGELTFSDRGIKSLLALQTGSLTGAFVADKIIGKAAAMLLARGGAIEVYAEVISEPALKVLHDRHILCVYEKLVPNIINREGTGICPMESAVLNMDGLDAAFEILKHNIKDRQ